MRSLKGDLASIDAYPALHSAAPSRVDVVETHISWVFLAGAEVYKVKKPVRFPFLDFSTIEQRRRACEVEVALNARLARDTYLGLVSVRRGADGRHFLGEGPGEVVDWAVRMRRLPDPKRADLLMARGALGEADVDRIAETIAAFHAACRADAETAAFGTREAVERSVRENFDETRAGIGMYLMPDEAAELERWQRAFLAEHGDLFERRAAAGRVRDGHGDLRLEHVYLEGERGVTIIDCIEFSDRFRFNDVCSDIAFFSMDLAWHGAVALAERFLARYARASNDFDLYAMVDFYESYRAFVRGKIAHLVASDEGVSAETRARARREARRYFLLALSGERRSLLAPTIVAVGGVIASGKSTIAEHIASELSAPVVEADRTRKHMLGASPTEKRHDGAWIGAYDLAFTDRVYDEVLRRADVVLASGRPVVVDASFRSAAFRSAVRELGRKRGVPYRFVECRVPRDVARERLVERARGESVSDGRLEIFDDFCARWEPVVELDPREHIVLDTSLPLEQTLARTREVIATWPRGFPA